MLATAGMCASPACRPVRPSVCLQHNTGSMHCPEPKHVGHAACKKKLCMREAMVAIQRKHGSGRKRELTNS